MAISYRNRKKQEGIFLGGGRTRFATVFTASERMRWHKVDIIQILKYLVTEKFPTGKKSSVAEH